MPPVYQLIHLPIPSKPLGSHLAGIKIPSN
nr:MAG TPA: hypothetical protein [Caudoviricetes sp.]